jgi:hypothetical protein
MPVLNLLNMSGAYLQQQHVVRCAGSSSFTMGLGLQNCKTGSVITSHAPSHRTCLLITPSRFAPHHGRGGFR